MLASSHLRLLLSASLGTAARHLLASQDASLCCCCCCWEVLLHLPLQIAGRGKALAQALAGC
jgi:hypothetical protein